jgi:hypothetical protein
MQLSSCGRNIRNNVKKSPVMVGKEIHHCNGFGQNSLLLGNPLNLCNTSPIFCHRWKWLPELPANSALVVATSKGEKMTRVQIRFLVVSDPPTQKPAAVRRAFSWQFCTRWLTCQRSPKSNFRSWFKILRHVHWRAEHGQSLHKH